MAEPELPLYPPSDKRNEILESAEYQSLLAITVGLLAGRSPDDCTLRLAEKASLIHEILIDIADENREKL